MLEIFYCTLKIFMLKILLKETKISLAYEIAYAIYKQGLIQNNQKLVNREWNNMRQLPNSFASTN